MKKEYSSPLVTMIEIDMRELIAISTGKVVDEEGEQGDFNSKEEFDEEEYEFKW